VHDTGRHIVPLGGKRRIQLYIIVSGEVVAADDCNLQAIKLQFR
jgi:hypothetical protein